MILSKVKGVSWKHKLSIVALMPMLSAFFAIGAVFLAVERQNSSIESMLERSEARQNAAATNLTAVMEMQVLLQSLIAANDEADIRAYAVASLKSASILDEYLQHLKLAMPENQSVDALREELDKIKTDKLKLIGHAKRNRDLKALAHFKTIDPNLKTIAEISQSILHQEQLSLSELAKRNRKEGQQLVGMIAVGLLIASLPIIFIASVFSRQLMASIARIRAAINEFRDGHLVIQLEKKCTGELATIGETLLNAVDTVGGVVGTVKTEAGCLLDQANHLTRTSNLSTSEADSISESISNISSKTESLLGLSARNKDELASV